MELFLIYPGCRYTLPWAIPICALPFLSSGDLWFSATTTNMNFRIRRFNFCTSNFHHSYLHYIANPYCVYGDGVDVFY